MSKATTLLAASLSGVLLVGCNMSGSGGDPAMAGSGSPGAPATPQARADDAAFLARAAQAAAGEGQITLNNPWGAADLARNEISPAVTWVAADGNLNFRRQGTTYTTLVSQYRERRKQCELDSQVTYRQRYPEGGLGTGATDNPDFPICQPVLTQDSPRDLLGNLVDCGKVIGAALNILPPGPRYGYWCGAGHPPMGVDNDHAPEPLDAVDFCCMMHDRQAWGASSGGINGPPERGMAMCLYMATEYPAGTMSKLPDVERARQFWYDCAAIAASGNQINSPAPVVGR